MFHIPRPKDGVYYSEKYDQIFLIDGCYIYWIGNQDVGHNLMFTMETAVTTFEAKWIGEF